MVSTSEPCVVESLVGNKPRTDPSQRKREGVGGSDVPSRQPKDFGAVGIVEGAQVACLALHAM